MHVCASVRYDLHTIDQLAYRRFHSLPVETCNLLQLRGHLRNQLAAVGMDGVRQQVYEGGRRLRDSVMAPPVVVERQRYTRRWGR